MNHNIKKLLLVLLTYSLIGCNSGKEEASQISNSTVTESTQEYAPKTSGKNMATQSTVLSTDIETFKPSDWYAFWTSNDWKSKFEWANAVDFERLEVLSYYAKIANNANLVTPDAVKVNSTSLPENVRRVIEVMPQANFEKIFPRSTQTTKYNGFVPANAYSYLMFLKAVAVMPAYCGNYASYPLAGKYKTIEMANPNLVCKKLLATTLAHAVQETSDGGGKFGTDMTTKIPATFASVAEKNYNNGKETPLRYPDAAGVFSDWGKYGDLVRNNAYYGRGAKQLSYPSNYANVSLMLYGDLRLVTHPDLVYGENILPYLTAIAYTLLPKDSRPSIIEVVDGSFMRDIKNSSLDNADKKYLEDNYAVGFPMTIALVNGGPECAQFESQPHNPINKNNVIPANTSTIPNTNNRMKAYQDFAKSGVLFTRGFTLNKHEATLATADGKYGACSEIKYNDPRVFDVSQRYYYININSDRKPCGVVKWATGIPMFGGEAVLNTFCKQ